MATESLSFQEIEEFLDSISSNRRLCCVEKEGSPEWVVFRYPIAEELFLSRYIRAKALADAKAVGLLTLEEVEAMVAKRRLVPESDKIELEDLQKKLEAQEKFLSMTSVPGRRAPIEAVIEELKKKINKVRLRGDAFLYLSQEKKADEEAILFLTWSSTYSVYGDKYWKSFRDFEDEQNILFRNEIIVEFSKFNRGLPIATIRLLARHSLWRIRYVAAIKMGGPLFERWVDDLTPDQLGLLYWSNFYQSIYEMLPDDQPDDETIANDEALDKHMEGYFKRRETERKEAKAKKSGSGTTGTGRESRLSAWDRGEVIVTPANPHYTELEYSEERIRAPEGISDVEVVSPQSKRARNMRARSRPYINPVRPRKSRR